MAISAQFLNAYVESFAAADLPFWRVFKTNPPSGRIPISGEQEWEEAWKQIETLRTSDPRSSYYPDHSIQYGRGSQQ